MVGVLPWRYASATVTGTSHLSHGGKCQDAHLVRLVGEGENTILLIAVSDGAGTAPAGDVGSRIAVQGLSEQVAEWSASGSALELLTQGTAIEWLHGVREQIAELAAADCQDMRDFACTLLCALIGGTGAAFFQIGDGAIVVSDAEEWRPIFWPQHGPYVNMTHFVTDTDASDRLLFGYSASTVSELALFSDGLEQLLLDFKSRTGHRPFFEHIMPPIRGSQASFRDQRLSEMLASYLSSPQVADRTNDDLTLVLASRRPMQIILSSDDGNIDPTDN